MPVRKFRDVSEIEETWYVPGDPALVLALRNVWGFATLATRPCFPPGVFKHRTIEAMNAQTKAWEDENFRAFQARRAAERALRTTEPGAD